MLVNQGPDPSNTGFHAVPSGAAGRVLAPAANVGARTCTSGFVEKGKCTVVLLPVTIPNGGEVKVIDPSFKIHPGPSSRAPRLGSAVDPTMRPVGPTTTSVGAVALSPT